LDGSNGGRAYILSYVVGPGVNPVSKNPLEVRL
jgi:hypothetical protein